MHQDFSTTRKAGDYWSLADQLRESCPHFYNKYSEGGYWVFTRHEAVNDIYKTPEIFSSESITPWEPNPIYRFVPTMVDAPDHIKYRRILNPWFSPKAMESAAPMIREHCKKYLDPIFPRGECEYIEDFALLFPTAAFLNVIGVPVSYTEQFAEWVDAFFGGFGGDPAGEENMASIPRGGTSSGRRVPVTPDKVVGRVRPHLANRLQRVGPRRAARPAQIAVRQNRSYPGCASMNAPIRSRYSGR